MLNPRINSLIKCSWTPPFVNPNEFFFQGAHKAFRIGIPFGIIVTVEGLFDA